MKVRKAFLVYQGGIANVFSVKAFNLGSFGREAKRLYQGDFRSAENICIGLGLAGVVVRTAVCNQAGDIIDHIWSDNLVDQPFFDKQHPVHMN